MADTEAMQGRAGVLVIVVLGCSGDDLASPAIDASPPPPDAAVPVFDVPLRIVGRSDLDILFVVDDSGAMRQEQEALANGLASLFAPLRLEEGGLPNLHIGIVSSNVGTGPEGGGGDACAGNGDNGILQASDMCAQLTDGSRFILDELISEQTGARNFNYTGSLEDQLGCMVQLGTQGCGFEQHLEAMRRALANQAENAGFVRADTMLAIIIVADEDDCSASDRSVFDPSQDDLEAPLGQFSSFRCFEFGVSCAGEEERQPGVRRDCVPDEESVYLEKVSSYVAEMTALKGRRGVAVATITGPPEPVVVGTQLATEDLWVEPACWVCPGGASSGCSPSPADPDGAVVTGFPAIRFGGFAAGFPIRSSQNICAYGDGALDFAPALDAIGRHLVDQRAMRCLAHAPADRRPDIEGLQPLCFAVDVPAEPEALIPSCDDAQEPCWRLVDQPDCVDSELALVIDRGDTAAPPETEVAFRCAE